MVVRQPVAAGTGEQVLFSSGNSSGSEGVYIESISGRFRANYGSATVDKMMTTNDGLNHVIQVIRSSNSAVVYVDGSASSPISVTGKGATTAGNSTIGAYNNGASLKGMFDILYTRIDASAITASQLAADREAIQGVLAQRDKAWTFTRSTANYMQSSTGKLISIPANVPRIGGEGGGVLIEGASTNLCLQSQTLDVTASWIQTECPIASNVAVAPDGTTTADGLVDTNVSSLHRIYQSIAMPAGRWAFSVFVKKNDTDKEIYLMAGDSVYSPEARFDPNLGVFTYVREPATTLVGSVPVGDYYRVWISGISSSADNRTFQIRSYSKLAGSSTYTGTPSTCFYVWGAQVEAQPFPTSYIPTTTAVVARGAESLSQSAAWLPSSISATGPTSKIKIQFEFNPEWDKVGEAYRILDINQGASKNRIDAFFDTDDRIYVNVRDNLDTTAHNLNVLFGGLTSGVANKWHTFVLYVDFATIANSYLTADANTDTAFSTNPDGSGLVFSSPPTITVGNGDGRYSFSKIRNLRISAE
jgi:hypothetical protein